VELNYIKNKNLWFK